MRRLCNDQWKLENMQHICIFSDLGDGWAVAVLDTQEECDFIKVGQERFQNSAPYWIAGSTMFYNVTIKYNDYIANNSGTITAKCLNCYIIFYTIISA